MRPKRGSGAWIRYGERLADGEIAFAAAHYRTAILQPWETEAAARLKDLRDDMVILAYRCLSSARDFEPAHRRASGLGFAEAQRRGWLARRASGRTLEWSTYPGHYQMRVWDEAYRRRWIEQVLEATAGTPFDGIMADNDVFDDYYGLDLRSLAPDDAAAPHDLAGLRAALGDFVDDVGRSLTDEGLLLVPNIAEARREAGRWERHAAWGGGFDECWLGWGDKALFDEETALAQAPQLDGPGLCIVRTPSGGVGPRFDRSASALYGLAAFWVFGGGPDHIDDSAGDSESAGSGFFKRDKGVVSAVDRVSITVRKGETYGLVGESGCGKSTVGRLIAGLEPPSGGAIELDGRDLATLKGRDAVRIHRDVQMMFQDSYAAMDPRMRIDQILAEPMSIQKTGNARQIAERIMEILEQVGLTEEILDRYPHEFSGGQLQRIGFARSLTLAPDLIVADEPVSALDVSVQAQVLNLMKDLQEELGLSYLFISHDLAVVQYMADRIGVMYLGRIVEEGPAEEVVASPKHPYTKALIDSIPVPDPAFEHADDAIKLTGEPPSAINPPEGCRFRPRCPFATDECLAQPPLSGGGHRVACHHPLAWAAAGAVVEEAPVG